MEEIDTTPIKPEKVKKSLSEAQIKNLAKMREQKKMKSEVKKFMVNNNMPLPNGETLGYKKKNKENTIDKLDNIQQNKENLPNQNNPIVKNSDEMKYDNDIIKKINDIHLYIEDKKNKPKKDTDEKLNKVVEYIDNKKLKKLQKLKQLEEENKKINENLNYYNNDDQYYNYRGNMLKGIFNK
jgi:hypothetical protein